MVGMGSLDLGVETHDFIPIVSRESGHIAFAII